MIGYGRLPNENEIKTTARNLHQLADDLLMTLSPDFPCGLDPEVTLHEWSLANRASTCLKGIVENHPILDDGFVRTSQIFFIDPIAGLARTYSRWYRLSGAQPAIIRPYN